MFQTTSSHELLGLRLVVEWARAAGLVRRVHSRLVAAQKKRHLLSRPMVLWERAFDVVSNLGEAICPPGMLESLIGGEFPAVVAALTRRLYSGPAAFDELSELSWRTATARCVLDPVPRGGEELWRRSTDGDTRRLLHALRDLALIELDDASAPG